MMKNFSKLAIAGAVFAFASIAAQAQTMRVSIPFKFHAGTEVLPAGEYQVKIDQQSRHITITGLDNKSACFLNFKAGLSNKELDRGQLVFHAYGSANFLQQVQPRASEGVELFTSRAEREMTKLNPVHEITTVLEGTD
jgi:hypothetical protein